MSSGASADNAISRGQLLWQRQVAKCLLSLRDSIVNHFEGWWIAATARIDAWEGSCWAERPLHRLVSWMGQDVEHIFLLIEELAQKRHDITPGAAQLLIRYIRQVPAPGNVRKKIKGLSSRVSQSLVKTLRDLDRYPGFASVYDEP